MNSRILAGETILVVEDELVLLLDLKRALEQAGARVRGAHCAEELNLSGAVLDGAATAIADRLTERRLPFVFCSGREPAAFARWPHAPVLGKPVSAEAVVARLAHMLRPNGSMKVASNPPSIEPRDILNTDALSQRPTRPRSRTAQVRAFHELSALVMSNPEAAVQRFLELAVELCDAGSAGWSRLGRNDAGDEVFWWDALAGELSPHVGGTAPRHLSPCGLCLDAGKSVLVAWPAEFLTYYNDIIVPMAEMLIVPAYDTGGAALGTIWVVHHDDKRFDASDVRIMEELAVQLVLALKLKRDAKTHGQQIAGKVALIQDTDHRVKNTIQSVASLLSLQARSCTVPEARSAIEEASARLAIFATVHEFLHAKGDDSRAVDMADIIDKLAGAFRAVRSDGHKRISLRVQVDHILLEPHIALPIALLVNEAITNAYKHAYAPEQQGEIFVRIATAANGGVRIGIQDDGVGFPADAQGRLGLTLIRSFASQLNGELIIQSDDGTSIHLIVPEVAALRPPQQADGSAPQQACPHRLERVASSQEVR
jgi:two-component sensor histidine kinase